MKTTVQEVMTKEVVTTRPDVPFKELVCVMQEHRVSAVPVVDPAGNLVGVVSEADLLLKEEIGSAPDEHLFERREHRREHRKAAGRVAGDLMTEPAITIGPRASLADAAALMHSARIKRLPVVEDGHVVGILSRHDLLSAFARSDAQIQEQIRDHVLHRIFSIPAHDVDVGVRVGVVSLTGKVERRTVAGEIERVVREVDGVVGVDSSLTWDEDDVAPMLQSFGRAAPWM